MVRLKFRVDDVSSNTNMYELREMCIFIRKEFDADIFLGVTIFSKYSQDGAVYPDAPFKDKPLQYFWDVNQAKHDFSGMYGDIASHGLFHVDHSQLQYDAQEMSIVSSCKYLETNMFIPPFNRFNQATEAVCRINGIKLLKLDDGWKSLEFNDFDESHDLWYFHPWRWTPETLKEKLCQPKR